MSRRGGTVDSFDFDFYLGKALWPKRHEAGRVCAHEGCATVLSVYNATAHCGAHQPEPDWHYCGMDVAVCASCGEAVVLRGGGKASRTCGACGAVRA